MPQDAPASVTATSPDLPTTVFETSIAATETVTVVPSDSLEEKRDARPSGQRLGHVGGLEHEEHVHEERGDLSEWPSDLWRLAHATEVAAPAMSS